MTMQSDRTARFVITIDTEEDDWGDYHRATYGVENIARIPSLQRVFSDRGVRPTYLVSYAVATDPRAIELLAGYKAQGLCEIGTHPHPWNTPPLEEERNVRNSFISNLPAELQYRKLKTLHDAISMNFGTPTSFRSGRWGFNEDVARNLIRLGYQIDSSLSPLSDWTEGGGPDYRRQSLDPFIYRLEAAPPGQAGSLLEVPPTIDFVQSWRTLAGGAYWRMIRSPMGAKIAAGLGRIGVLNHVCLSPETHSSSQMISLVSALLERGTRVFNMFFHSPSVLPGCSPFVRTEADALAFVDRVERVLAVAQSAGMQFVTLSELRADDVGASTVRPLAAVA
jgi:hypothetical protein